MSTLKHCRLGFWHSEFNLVYYVDERVDAFSAASNSVILSMAAYLTWKFPKLSHPAHINKKIKVPISGANFPSPFLSVHPLFEEWC